MNEVKTIEALRGTELKAKYKEVLGAGAKSNNRPYLIRKIIETLKEKASKAETKALPAAPEGTSSRAKKAATPKKAEDIDPRLPAVGSVLEREHGGKNIRVKILDSGFEYQGKTYTSLSAIANEATGTTWNGFLFFRLIPYTKRAKKTE